MKLLSKREGGQALILALVLLLIGGLMIPPLLALASTGLKSSQVYEQKTDELYASISGVEDALWKITHDASLADWECGNSEPYALPPVNGLPVDVVVTKLSLIEGLVSGEEYRPDQPHEGWGEFEAPEAQAIRDYEQGWVEYSCNAAFTYIGGGNRQLETMGAFFAPYPGDTSLIEGPYDIDYTGVMTGADADLEDGSPETKIASGGFAFIWKWQEHQGPTFSTDESGAVSFTFKIHDPDWFHSNCFLWATFKEQDISYVTDAPGLYKWLIEATAGDTTVRSVVIENIGSVSVLTWEIQ